MAMHRSSFPIIFPIITDGLIEPTGFETRSTSTVTFDNGTRTLTISPVGDDFVFWRLGSRFIKTSPESIQITDVEGLHYIFYDSTGTLQDTVNPDDSALADLLRLKPTIASIYWDVSAAVQIYTGDERHGSQMSGSTHSHFHFTKGTKFLNGLVLGDFSIDGTGNDAANAQFSVANGTILDEDLAHQAIDGLPQELDPIAEIPLFHLSGLATWNKIASTTFPITTTGSGRAAFNLDTAGTWSLEEVTNNRFVLYHYFATNDNSNHIIGIVGQAEYTTIISARAGAIVELTSLVTAGLPFQEFVPIATVIWQTADSYGNAVKSKTRTTDEGDNYIDWRFADFVPATGAVNSHSSLSGLSNDDHLQYVLANGTRDITGIQTFTGVPTGIGVGQGSLYINPASASADFTLFGVALNGSERFRIDEDGDVTVVGNIEVRGSIRNMFNMTARASYYTDFIGDSIPGEWSAVSAGTGAIITLRDGATGVVRMTSGTSFIANSFLTLGTNSVRAWNSSKNPVIEFAAKTSVMTNNVRHTFIISGNTNSAISEWAGFTVQNGINSGNYQCTSDDNVAAETTNTAISSTSQHILRLELTSSDIKFYIDDVLQATHTTRLLSGNLLITVGNIQIANPGTSGWAELDAFYAEQDR